MKKRILGVLLASCCAISLASCNGMPIIPGTTQPANSVTTTTEPTTVVTPTVDPTNVEPSTTVVNPTQPTVVNPTTIGSTTIEPTVVTPTVADPTTANPTTETTGSTTNENHRNFETPEIPGPVDPSTVEFTKKHFKDSMKENGPFSQDAFPATGEPTMLVIPVNLKEDNKTDEIYNNIKTAFAGTEEETGWESVQSFYYKSSYEQLNIKFEFTDWFTPAHDIQYYENVEDGYGDEEILKEALNHFDSTIDFSKYDYDEDSFIDNIWVVYNCPVDYTNTEFWWAWQTKVQDDVKFDGKTLCRYGWAGTDFMDPSKEEQSYDTTNIKVDAHTFIHESGHIMGLEDYYDYDEENGPVNRGLFGADMMDYNIGDHCSFNKISLGWIDPILVSGNGKKEFTLGSFTTTGDVLLLANHDVESIWDEYFLIEFYTNDGLNKNDTPVYDYEDNPAMGIRILHVDAHLSLDKDGNVVLNGDESYPETGFLYDNSGTDKPLIEMLRADYSSSMEEYLYPESLYSLESNTFGKDTWSSFKLNDGSDLFFTLSVKAIENGQCTIEINLM